jgi:hypothetical protein
MTGLWRRSASIEDVALQGSRDRGAAGGDSCEGQALGGEPALEEERKRRGTWCSKTAEIEELQEAELKEALRRNKPHQALHDEVTESSLLLNILLILRS